MFYNILYTGDPTYWRKFEAVNEGQLKEFVQAYDNGERDFHANGGTQLILGTTKIFIYDSSKVSALNSRGELLNYMRKSKSSYELSDGVLYASVGEDVTADFITGRYGHKKKLSLSTNVEDNGKESEVSPSEIISTPRQEMSHVKEMKQESPRKIFISHSSRDSEVVNMFCKLVLSAGLNINLQKDVFNTSLAGSMPKSGEDFRSAIRNHLVSAKMVLQFISKNYKKSEVCLNEMGAAWVLSHTVIPMIIEEGTYDVGFINSTTQQVQLHDEHRIIAFVEEHKDVLCPGGHSMIAVSDNARTFVKWLREYEANDRKEDETIVESKAETVNMFVKPLVKLPPNERKFYKIDDHGKLYYCFNGELREVPDTTTLYFLGYKPTIEPFNLAPTDELAHKIGKKMTSIFECEVWADKKNAAYAKKDNWLIYEGRRHLILNDETLRRILYTPTQPGVKQRTARQVSHEEIYKLSQENSVDLSKKS